MIKVENLIGLSITQFFCKKFDSNSTGYTELVVQISNYYLQITVNDYTDELIVHIPSLIETNQFFIPDWANNFTNKSLFNFGALKMKKDILIYSV